jgi:hypothetical protein
MIVVQCPKCQAKFMRTNTTPASTSLKCPKCSNLFSLGAIALPQDPQPVPQPPPSQPTVTQSAFPPPKQRSEQEHSSEVQDIAPTKIASTVFKGRAPINWVVAIACIFVSGSIWSYLYIPALAVEKTGGADTVQFLLFYFSAVLGGALFAGVFVSAMCSRDRLWQPLYTGVVGGFVDGLLVIVLVIQAFEGREEEVPAWLLGLVFVGTLLVVSLTTILGAVLERSLMAFERRILPPHKWIYKTRDGRKLAATAPARYPIQAIFWSIMRWAFLFSWAPMLCISAKEACRSIVPSMILFVVCGRLTQKCRVLSAQDILEQDKRPPIVYLRSFRDDGRASGGSRWSAWGGWITDLASPPFEDILARTMQRYGPFVAIGRPGEELADVGAARMYVSDEDWQAVVSDLLAWPGSMAFLQAGETAGLRWELQTAGETLRPDQLLIFLPFAFEVSDRKRESQYAGFRSWASECLPAVAFPDRFPLKTRFFYFQHQAAWEIERLQRTSKVSRKHPLAEVLLDLQANWGLIRPKRQTPRWLLVSLLILAAILVFVILIGVLTLAIQGRGKKTHNQQSQPGLLNAPIELVRTEYLGKTMPYRIRLDENWKENPNPHAKADREFNIPGGPSLVILIFNKSFDVEVFATALLENLGKNHALLERKTVHHRGHTWLECLLKYTTKEGTGWMTYRFWSNDQWTVVIQIVSDKNDERTTRQIKDALDSFELPSDVKADP